MAQCEIDEVDGNKAASRYLDGELKHTPWLKRVLSLLFYDTDHECGHCFRKFLWVPRKICLVTY
jgi:hypothetical protein